LTSGQLTILLVIAGYLFGSLNSAYYLCRFVKGIDLRTFGSSNAGATNTARILGKKGFIAVFIIDFLKGTAIVYTTQKLNIPSIWQPWILFATVLGHNHPIQLKGRGGKGISTLSGGVLGYSPYLCLGSLLVLILSVWLTGKKLIMGMIVYGSLGFSVLIITGNWIEASGFFALSILVVTAHKENFTRTEPL
jgi:glycerol-3-phosphate acyltransferase PlsY